ncbi:MAG TPA: M67 family metallopeptidase [Candidatus Manganitrophaceae bacterium]|nr:M67 family metallopeptidase [Candidatus Manganitrophaceae bacterium]
MIKIPQSVIDNMISHAQSEAPNECCGLLGGRGEIVEEIYRITNLPADDPKIADLKVPADRRFRYMMDPKEQLLAFKKMREGGTTLVGIYHSHPHSPAYPSATDVRLAFYSDVWYLIISLEEKERPQLRAFRIVEGKITEEKIEAAESS